MRNYIDLVEKTLSVLHALGDGAVTLKDIAARTGLLKSSAFRILYTLKELGYVERPAGNGTYRVTCKVLELSRGAPGRPLLLTLARPYLNRLRDVLQESIWLAELRGRAMILIDVANTAQKLRLSLDIGDRCPFHASAVGKAVAAFLSPEELDVVIGREKLKRFTPKTITSRARFMSELATVRRDGYAMNKEETVEGAFLVGAPIFDAASRPFGAISASCLVSRCSDPQGRRVQQMIRETMAAAAAITAEVGRTDFQRPDIVRPGSLERLSAEVRRAERERLRVDRPTDPAAEMRGLSQRAATSDHR